jgi:hypothetical protein
MLRTMPINKNLRIRPRLQSLRAAVAGLVHL